MFEFNKRHHLAKTNGKPIKSSRDVFKYAAPKIAEFDKEYFMVLHLDSRNKILRDEIISIGTLNSSLVHPREVFKSAIKESANSIILVHNHPSGDPTPSAEDLIITEKLMGAGKLLDLEVLDHVIIGKKKFWSFKDSRVD